MTGQDIDLTGMIAAINDLNYIEVNINSKYNLAHLFYLMVLII